MKKILSIALLTALGISVAQAAPVKFEIGAGMWNASPSGDINFEGSKADLEKDFGLEKEKIGYFYTDLQHPLPVVPNLRLEYTNLSFDGKGDTTIDFGGQTFNVGGNTTNIELKTLDAILYYNVLDSFNVNLDLGLDAKYVEGYASVQNSLTKEETDFKVVVPHLYGNLRYEIPVIKVGIEAEGKYFGYDGAKSYDYSIKADYNVIAGLKIEGGYRTTRLEIPEEFADKHSIDSTINYEFSGPFLGINYTF